MKISNWFWLIAISALLSFGALAEPAQPLDLKSPVAASKAEIAMAHWPMPHGRQVLDGIPFQIDRAFLFSATNSTQKDHPGLTNLNDIAVARRFERLHLLAATDTGGPDGVAVAKVHLLYTDGSESALELNFGEHFRSWLTAWHKEEAPLKNPDARMAWRHQDFTAAQSDKYLRLFHVALANPSPEKEVRALAIESANTQYGLVLMAISVGPAAIESLPDTTIAARSPFPDLRPRQGEPAQGEGLVMSKEGQPLAGARIRVMAAREFNTEDRDSTEKHDAVGLGAETDANGHFTLPPMPDNRLYRLLIWAQGYEAARYRGMDPKSDPIEIRLKPRPTDSANPKFTLPCRVVGPDDKPIPFAVIEPDGVGSGGGRSWGGPQGFPGEIIADAKGEFMFGRDKEFDRLQLRIDAPGLAPAHLWLNVTNQMQTVKLTVGASIRGRVLKDGKPLANMTVGVSGADRNSEVYAGNFETKTATNGDFVFEHLQAETAWEFYGTMVSFKEYGALPPRPVTSAGNGQGTDLGDLPVVSALHLAGHVKTRNGEPLPKGMKIYVGYDDAWDSQSIAADAEGRFSFDGLSARLIEVSLQQRGWHLTSANRSLDMWNPWRLNGLLEQNKDDLLLLIDKGERQYNNGVGGNGQLPTADQPQSRPIWGGEDSGPPFIILTGHVVDDKTGQPITNFQIVPGYKPPVTSMPPVKKSFVQKALEPFGKKPFVPWNERIYWQYSRTEAFSNGSFSLPFIRLTSQPVLRIEASGYQPLETEPIGQTTTNLTLRLTNGVGLNGIVTLPKGGPAKDASVIYGVREEQFSLNGTSLNNYGNPASRQITLQDGKFSFEQRAQGSMIFAAHPAGWAQQSVEQGADGITLQLRPWASVIGTLLDTNNAPMPGIKLMLTMFHDWQQGAAMVNLQNQCVTDAQGHFTFTNVPPTRLEVQRLIPNRFGTGETYSMQTWTIAQPGITNDLGKVTLDQPPPDSAFDQIKKRLGL